MSVKGGVKGLRSRAQVRDKVRECGFSSLMKQKKKQKFASSFTSPDFFLKKNSVMKCLRSKKRLKSPVTTT